MRTIIWSRRLALLLAILLFAASHAAGQVAPGTSPVVYTEAGTYRVAWDASAPSSPAPEDAVVGYQVVASQAIQTGQGTNVFVKTWDVGNVTNLALPGAQLPSSAFYLSVRAKSAAGVISYHSNTLPFVPAGRPSAPPNLRIETP